MSGSGGRFLVGNIIRLAAGGFSGSEEGRPLSFAFGCGGTFLSA